MKQCKIGLIGAGERGARCYAPYAKKFPSEVQFTCVAEPDAARREAFADAYGIAPENRFDRWEALLDAKPELDGLIIATQDVDHYAPAMRAIDMGYHLLLEKPMAETIEKTRAIVQLAQEKRRLVMVCHVLRYTPFFRAIKEVLDRGMIGPIQAVHHLENIGNFHFSHSFVRGHWHNTRASTPMIVAKCCHDMDILNFLIGKRCERISSFGSLRYFVRENAPQGATHRCADCPHNKRCNFSAYQYLNSRALFPVFRDMVMRTEDTQAFIAHLADSPYGRCVYDCDNDAVDRQVVNMEYEDGVTVSFTASAFTNDISRQIKIMGTRGEIEGKLEDDAFVVRDFGTGNEAHHCVVTPKTLHSGGDELIMANFLEALRDPEQGIKTFSASLSLQGHAMAFAAEQSRVTGQVVQLQ